MMSDFDSLSCYRLLKFSLLVVASDGRCEWKTELFLETELLELEKFNFGETPPNPV